MDPGRFEAKWMVPGVLKSTGPSNNRQIESNRLIGSKVLDPPRTGQSLEQVSLLCTELNAW